MHVTLLRRYPRQCSKQVLQILVLKSQADTCVSAAPLIAQNIVSAGGHEEILKEKIIDADFYMRIFCVFFIIRKIPYVCSYLSLVIVEEIISADTKGIFSQSYP